MSFSCGFFDAKDRDRVYTAESFTSYLSSLICNGVLDTYGNCFAVTANNNLSVTVGTGKAWLNGHYFTSDAPHTLNLSSYVDASLNKFVAVGICCDTAARECSLVVRAGAAAQSPGIPALTSIGAQTYLTLAAVYLPAGVNAIIADDITDFREDESKCGYVKCILGKCGVSDLVERFAELERRAAALENILGLEASDLPVVAFSGAATGLTVPVGDMQRGMGGIVAVMGSLDGMKIEKEEK